MTFKEAVNSLYTDYVVVVPGVTPDIEEPLLAGGLEAIKDISEYMYSERIVKSIIIDDDTAKIILED